MTGGGSLLFRATIGSEESDHRASVTDAQSCEGEAPAEPIFIRAKPFTPCMAKRGQRQQYLKGNIDEDLPLPILAGAALIKADFDEVAEEKTRVSSIVASWSMDSFTPGDDVGPITVGIAHSDYSAAEIEEVIENLGSWSPGSKVEQEVAKRLVRKIGIFGATGEALSPSTLNDGVPIKTKLNWTLVTGDTLAVWAYNEGSGAISVTVPNVHVQGHANLWI